MRAWFNLCESFSEWVWVDVKLTNFEKLQFH